MGKAKERRKRWRSRYLAALKACNSEKFKQELDKRLASWTEDIWELAEVGKIKGLGVFALADRAKNLLTETGQPVSEILNQECCQALSVKQGFNKYRIICFYGRLLKTAR